MSGSDPPSSSVRTIELIAVLALGADLGMGQPMDHAMRQCVIARRIGQRLGLLRSEESVVYYVSLLAWVGCHIDAYEQAKWFGDDLALKGGFREVDPVGVRAAGQMLGRLGGGRRAVSRVSTLARFVSGGARDAMAMLHNHAYAADQLARELGLPAVVGEAVVQTFERFDGKGAPDGRKGTDIALAARVVNLADVLAVFYGAGGPAAAIEVAAQRRGTQFDPDLVDLIEGTGDELFSDLNVAATWQAVIDTDPSPAPPLPADELDTALEAIADFADIKSPYTLGHTRAVAELATSAAKVMMWSPREITHIRRAALLHDIGRLGVSNGIWDNADPLSATEVERIRLHPYLTDRMLAASPGLAVYGATAAQHHERLDGSGYPYGLRGDALSTAGRLLAATDTYVTKIEERPHRLALSVTDAGAHLRAEVAAGRLDAEAVDAVLGAAGHPLRRRREWPAGLTTREVEVLRLLSRGLSNKKIAERLVIARKTVDNHVEHIYSKLSVSNRAQASLVAVRHGLIAPLEDGGFTP
jgi:HD-GYP domain-containing protein (c-di-GMP phosphodiesterase class II)/DNA-binding CsgD family transcriptional regulator